VHSLEEIICTYQKCTVKQQLKTNIDVAEHKHPPNEFTFHKTKIFFKGLHFNHIKHIQNYVKKEANIFHQDFFL
jgi:hypothetical protein